MRGEISKHSAQLTPSHPNEKSFIRCVFDTGSFFERKRPVSDGVSGAVEPFPCATERDEGEHENTLRRLVDRRDGVERREHPLRRRCAGPHSSLDVQAPTFFEG